MGSGHPQIPKAMFTANEEEVHEGSSGYLQTELEEMPLTTCFKGAEVKGSVIVQPLLGLANRLRVVASASITARYAGRTLYLNWVADDRCRAEWRDIFENEMPSFPCPLPPDARIYQNEPVNFADPGPGNLTNDIDDVILVRTYFNFKPRKMSMEGYLKQKSEFYRQLIPVAPVRERLEELRERYFGNHPVIGVHIRHTDLVLAGDPSHYVSPTSLFIKRMKQLMVSYPDVMFFLSTDDKKDEEHILEEFHGRVFIHPKTEVSRNTKDGIRDALVDWLALSETRLILRSVGTSFSREAALLRGVPKESIRRPLWPYTRYRYWMEAFRRRIAVVRNRYFMPRWP